MTYYETRKEELKTKSLEYYYNNKEKIRAYQKGYQDKLTLKRREEKKAKQIKEADPDLARLSYEIFMSIYGKHFIH